MLEYDKIWSEACVIILTNKATSKGICWIAMVYYSRRAFILVDYRLIQLRFGRRLKFHWICLHVQQWKPTMFPYVCTIHGFIDTCVMDTTSSHIYLRSNIEFKRIFLVLTNTYTHSQTHKSGVCFWSDLPTILILNEWLSSITMTTHLKKNPPLLPMLLQQMIPRTKLQFFL